MVEKVRLKAKQYQYKQLGNEIDVKTERAPKGEHQERDAAKKDDKQTDEKRVRVY